jgi:hypothetical protein
MAFESPSYLPLGKINTFPEEARALKETDLLIISQAGITKKVRVKTLTAELQGPPGPPGPAIDNIDGGFANSVYLPVQQFDGGGA